MAVVTRKRHRPVRLDSAEAFLPQQALVVSVVDFEAASGVIMTVVASGVGIAVATVVALVVDVGGSAIKEAEALAAEVGTVGGDLMDLALPLRMLLLAQVDVAA